MEIYFRQDFWSPVGMGLSSRNPGQPRGRFLPLSRPPTISPSRCAGNCWSLHGGKYSPEKQAGLSRRGTHRHQHAPHCAQSRSVCTVPVGRPSPTQNQTRTRCGTCETNTDAHPQIPRKKRTLPPVAGTGMITTDQRQWPQPPKKKSPPPFGRN